MKVENVIKIISPRSTIAERMEAMREEHYSGDWKNGLIAALGTVEAMLEYTSMHSPIDGKCPTCGEELQKCWAFCPHCGQSIRKEVEDGDSSGDDSQCLQVRGEQGA